MCKYCTHMSRPENFDVLRRSWLLDEVHRCLRLHLHDNDSSPLVSFVHVYLIHYPSRGYSHNEAMEDITMDTDDLTQLDLR